MSFISYCFGYKLNRKNPIKAKFQNLEEKLEHIKGVIRIRKSKKDRQHNVQKKKNKFKDEQLFTKHYT